MKDSTLLGLAALIGLVVGAPGLAEAPDYRGIGFRHKSAVYGRSAERMQKEDPAPERAVRGYRHKSAVYTARGKKEREVVSAEEAPPAPGPVSFGGSILGFALGNSEWLVPGTKGKVRTPEPEPEPFPPETIPADGGGFSQVGDVFEPASGGFSRVGDVFEPTPQGFARAGRVDATGGDVWAEGGRESDERIFRGFQLGGNVAASFEDGFSLRWDGGFSADLGRRSSGGEDAYGFAEYPMEHGGEAEFPN